MKIFVVYFCFLCSNEYKSTTNATKNNRLNTVEEKWNREARIKNARKIFSALFFNYAFKVSKFP